MAPSSSRKRPTQSSSHRKGPKATVATKAKTAPGAASTSNSVQASTSYVPHSSLKWSTVHVPTEALSGGAGTTDSSFFQGFSFDDDDFMGLQEVDDVDVEFLRTKDGGRTIKFKAAQDKVKGANGKRKQQEDDPERRQREEGDDDDERNEETVELQESPADQRKKSKRSRTDKVAGNVIAASNQAEGNEEDYVSPFLAEEEIADGGDKDESGPEDDEEPASATDAAASDNDPDDDDLAVAFSKVPSADIDLYDDEEGDDAEGDEQDNEFDETLLPGWSSIPLHPELKRGLFNMKFIQPTEIQARSLPPALGLGLAGTGLDASSAEDSDEEEEEESSTIGAQRDVIGVSQTGSGKTLAYGLPILQWLFHNAPGSIPMPSVAAGSDDEGTDSLPTPLGALVLTPTRELALQVAAHLSDVIKASCRSSPTDAAVSKRKLSRRPHIAVICGGMSEQKQRRLLEGQSRKSGGADIIVATPGRLWEMARLDDHLAARIKRTRFLVLDEADRMVEVGHFAEMEHILKLVSRDGAEAPEDDANEEQEEEGKDGVLTSGVRPSENMQTFVFSATLSKALQINLKKRKRAQVFSKKKGKGGRKAAEATTLDDLMDRVDFRDAQPYLVDLTRGQGLPAGLIETKLECLHTDKDLYLYYFLLRYPGRTLVFVNSIDGIRRLHPILTNLQLRVFPLHSQLQQKQRLKNLDRFRATQLSRAASADQKMAAAASALEPASLGGSSSVLLATDVAARGLDIPAVDHVVHYQLPRSADSYVHRSGRTARAGGTGVALALVEPKEKKLWSSICRALRKKQDTLTLPVTYSLLPHLRNRLTLARTIDAKQHVSTKAAHEDSWLRTLAAEAELDFAPFDGSDADDTGAGSGGMKAKQHQAEVRDLRAQLEAALRQPLFQRGSSKRYITAATAANRDGLASALIGSNNHESVLGLESSSLQADLQSLSNKRDTSDKKKSLAAKAPASVAVTANVPATPSVVPTPTTAKVTAKAKAKRLTPTQQQKRKAKQLAQQVLKQKRAKLLAAAAANAA